MSSLTPADLRLVAQRLPRDIREMLANNEGIFVGGGFIRAVVAGETPNDIDDHAPAEGETP